MQLQSTLSCALANPKSLILNFASAKNPGGGFLKGSLAQEESLARASGLYHSLTCPLLEKFYVENKKDKTCLYTHYMIYSPNVPIWRNDAHALVDPVLCSFISAPAVNAKHAKERVNPSLIMETMRTRAEYLLAVAAHNGHTNLILGSWGTGVFGNTVYSVAEMWRQLLVLDNAKFKNTFEKVIFAILDSDTQEKFTSIFDGTFIYNPAEHEPRAPRRGGQQNDNPRGRGRGQGNRGRGRQQGQDAKFSRLQDDSF